MYGINDMTMTIFEVIGPNDALMVYLLVYYQATFGKQICWIFTESRMKSNNPRPINK